MRQYLMIVIELDAKHCVGEQLGDGAAELDQIFLSH
jgi:hypothetical protein